MTLWQVYDAGLGLGLIRTGSAGYTSGLCVFNTITGGSSLFYLSLFTSSCWYTLLYSMEYIEVRTMSRDTRHIIFRRNLIIGNNCWFVPGLSSFFINLAIMTAQLLTADLMAILQDVKRKNPEIRNVNDYTSYRSPSLTNWTTVPGCGEEFEWTSDLKLYIGKPVCSRLVTSIFFLNFGFFKFIYRSPSM